jgi:hypothetical protein
MIVIALTLTAVHDGSLGNVRGKELPQPSHPRSVLRLRGIELYRIALADGEPIIHPLHDL